MNTKKISRPVDHPDQDDKNLINKNLNKFVDSELTPKVGLINLPLDMIKFLKILDPDAEHFHFQVFDDSGKNNIFPEMMEGSLEEKAKSLAAKNKAGAGIFVAIQPHSKDKPRKAEFTTRIRTFLIDLDGAPLEPVLETLKKAKLNPNMVVITSPGKFHIYLKVSGCPLNKYSAVQKALAAMFDGDSKVHDLPRVARVVGSWHKKDPGNPFKVKFRSVGNAEPYTFDQIVSGLSLDLNQVRGNGTNRKNGREANNGSKNEATPLASNEIPEGERNTTIFAIGRRLRALDIPEQEIKAAIVKTNEERCNPPLDDDEINIIFQSILKYSPDPNPFGVITPEGEGDIAKVMRNSGVSDLTKDSTADVINRTLHIAVELTKGMGGSSQVLLRGEIQKKLKFIGVQSPATLVNQTFPKPKPEKESEEKASLLLEDPIPFDSEVDGNVLLNEILEIFKRFIILPKHADVALSLWVLFAWAHEAFQISPLLDFRSPTKRCGKTTALRVLSRLVPRPLPVANISTAALFRSIEHYQPTLIVDEVDTFLENNVEIHGVLNAGHERDGAYVLRVVGDDHEPKQFCVWAPKIISGIGRRKDTLEDRSIRIPMERKISKDIVDRLGHKGKHDFITTREKCLRWANDHKDQLMEANPSMPNGLDDRAKDNWEPLLSIADLCGGEWPEIAREAASAISGDPGSDNESIAEMLLEDIRVFFDSDQGESDVRIPSNRLASYLESLEERPWPEFKKGKRITTRQIADILKQFGIKSCQMRIKNKNIRGYFKNDFQEAFTRYLPATSAT